jgi:hypothetical protein
MKLRPGIAWLGDFFASQYQCDPAALDHVAFLAKTYRVLIAIKEKADA